VKATDRRLVRSIDIVSRRPPIPSLREAIDRLVRSRLDPPERAMRASISYLTSTAATVPASTLPYPARHGAHRLALLGYHRGEHAIYLREEVGAELPVIYVVRTRGEHAGRMVPLRSWYEPGDAAMVTATLGARLVELARELTPMEPIEPDAWCLTTRVVQRRALRLPDGGRPIRKFALQLTVAPIVVGGAPRIARTVVTAYLRPRAQLDSVWAIPGEALAVARVSYLGVPEGIGLDKQVALLVGRELH
jgi:hypothetical protein